MVVEAARIFTVAISNPKCHEANCCTRDAGEREGKVHVQKSMWTYGTYGSYCCVLIQRMRPESKCRNEVGESKSRAIMA
jgi:hypothetical protein